MIDQVIIGNKASYDDFEASVKSRVKKAPEKKSIKETVPYSNKTYDFSKINGEIYWNEGELEYTFEICANSAEELEEKKIPFKSWVMNVMEEELHDPFTDDYHFIATFSGIEEDDSEIIKTTITVKFTVYPYMIADEAKIYTEKLTAGEMKKVIVENNSSHRITPTINTDVAITIRMGGETYTALAGEITDEAFTLAEGENELNFTADESGIVTITFYEEVF